MSSTPAALLYSAESHEQPRDEPWVEARVRNAIAQIVNGADDAFDPDGLWPVEEWDSRGMRLPLTGLYAEAAGVVLAPDQLPRMTTAGQPRWLERRTVPSWSVGRAASQLVPGTTPHAVTWPRETAA